jgi:hypothetical protein
MAAASREDPGTTEARDPADDAVDDAIDDEGTAASSGPCACLPLSTTVADWPACASCGLPQAPGKDFCAFCGRRWVTAG